jgi:MFS-type transporter involved in bile tolerance (Atg22 family)
MKFSLTLVSLSLNAVLVQSVSIPNSLLPRSCSPGGYGCTSGFGWCARYQDSIVLIFTHVSPLLIMLGYASNNIYRLSAMLRALISTLWHAADLGDAVSLTALHTACREVWYIPIKRQMSILTLS